MFGRQRGLRKLEGEHLGCSPCDVWRVVRWLSRLAGYGGAAVALVKGNGLYQRGCFQDRQPGIQLLDLCIGRWVAAHALG